MLKKIFVIVVLFVLQFFVVNTNVLAQSKKKEKDKEAEKSIWEKPIFRAWNFGRLARLL